MIGMLQNNNHFLKDNIPQNGTLTQVRKLLITLPPVKMSNNSMGNGRGVVDRCMDDKLD